MQSFVVRARRWALLLFSLGLGACSVQSTFRAVGGTPEWRAELAPPDPAVAEPGTLAIRSFCPTLDKMGVTEQLGERIRAAAAQSAIGPMRPLADRAKQPQFEIVLSEAGDDGKFTGNRGAAVLAGVGSGVVTTLLSRNLLLGGGSGLLGGALAYVGLGKHEDRLVFRVECHQCTSAEGSARLSSDRTVTAIEAGGVADADFGESTAYSQAERAVDTTYFDVKSNRLCWVKFFAVQTSAGGFVSAAKRAQSAADEILAQFPSYVFGGRQLF